jgi:hypothetical protein
VIDAAFSSSSAWTTARNAGIVVAGLFWLATAYWVLKDARRRIQHPLLVALASLVGLAIPFLGPLVYLFLRPPEYLDDVRERELEMRAIEQRLTARSLECPVCRAPADPSYLVCPVCTTRLKQGCSSCGAPLEAIWLACPYCATPVPPASALADTVEPLRPRRHAASD